MRASHIGKSTSADFQFTVIVVDAANLANWNTNYWLETNPGDSYYIDINGDEIVALTPVLVVSY